MTARRYKDLNEHLKLLEEKGLLIRVAREINKDTELHPLVRWQYRYNRCGGWCRDASWRRGSSRGYGGEDVAKRAHRSCRIPDGTLLCGSR